MGISSIQKSDNRAILNSSPVSERALLREERRGGRVDRLEGGKELEPPSVFKKIIYDPIAFLVRLALRGIFRFFDFLRSVAFDQPVDRIEFQRKLKDPLRAKEILARFQTIFSEREQNQIYQTFGEMYKAPLSWKERIWSRSPEENICLGRKIVQKNPLHVRQHLLARLEENPPSLLD